MRLFSDFATRFLGLYLIFFYNDKCKECNFTDFKTKKMIEEIKQIIGENSEEKHFVEYGKGVFATDDAVDEMAEEIVKLFSLHTVSSTLQWCYNYVNKNKDSDEKTSLLKHLKELGAL